MESRSILFFCHSKAGVSRLTSWAGLSSRRPTKTVRRRRPSFAAREICNLGDKLRPHPMDAVQPLRDEAFEAVSTGGVVEGLAVAALMIAEFDSIGRFRGERSQAAISLAERKGNQIFGWCPAWWCSSAGAS